MREGAISISEEGFSKKWNSKYKGPEARTSLANSEDQEDPGRANKRENTGGKR